MAITGITPRTMRPPITEALPPITKAALLEFEASLSSGNRWNPQENRRVVNALQTVFFPYLNNLQAPQRRQHKLTPFDSSLYSRVEDLMIQYLKLCPIKRQEAKVASLAISLKIIFTGEFGKKYNFEETPLNNFYSDLYEIFFTKMTSQGKSLPLGPTDIMTITGRFSLLKDPTLTISDVVLTAHKINRIQNAPRLKTTYFFHRALFAGGRHPHTDILPLQIYPLILQHLSPQEFSNLFRACVPPKDPACSRQHVYSLLDHTLDCTVDRISNREFHFTLGQRSALSPTIQEIETHLGPDPHNRAPGNSIWQLPRYLPNRINSIELNSRSHPFHAYPPDLRFPFLHSLQFTMNIHTEVTGNLFHQQFGPLWQFDKLSNWLSRCPNVTSVDILAAENHIEGVLSTIINNTKQARSPSNDITAGNPSILDPSRLTKLRVRSSAQVQDNHLDQLPALLERFQLLRSIYLEEFPLDERVIRALCSLTNLTKISLSLLSQNNPLLFPLDLPTNSSVTSLSLEFGRLSLVDFCNLLRAFPNLEYFSAFSTNLREFSTELLPQPHRHLKSLTFDQIRTQLPVHELLQRFPVLESFYYPFHEEASVNNAYAGDDFPNEQDVVFPHIREMDLTGHRLAKENLPFMLSAMPGLKSLILRNNSLLHSLEEISLASGEITQLLDMKKLDLGECDIEVTRGFMESIMRSFPSLEELILSVHRKLLEPVEVNLQLDEPDQGAADLTIFEYFVVENPPQVEIPLQSESHQNLKRLTLSNYEILDLDTLWLLFKMFPHLEYLCLDFSIQDNEMNLADLPQNSHLQVLEYSHNVLSLDGIYQLLDKFPNLNLFKFYSCFQNTWDTNPDGSPTMNRSSALNAHDLQTLREIFPHVTFETNVSS